MSSNDWPTPQELEWWASRPIEQIQEDERRAYGTVLSLRRSTHDTPSKVKKRRVMGTPTKADMVQLQANQPAWPANQKPDPRWSDAELDSYIASTDLELAQQPLDQPLDLQTLSNRQLEQLANAATAEEVAAIEDSIRVKRRAKQS